MIFSQHIAYIMDSNILAFPFSVVVPDRPPSLVWDEAAKSATYKFGYFSQPERPPVRVTSHESEDIVIQRESGSHNIGYDATTPKVDVNYAMSHHFGVLLIIWQHDEFIVSYDLTGEI